MSINASSYQARVVEMAALKRAGQNDALFQSTNFNDVQTPTEPEEENCAPSVPAPSPSPAPTEHESASDREELSSASTTSIDTDYSTDIEEHRHLDQSLLYECFTYSSTCSDSDQSYTSTLEDDAFSCSSMTTDTEDLESSDDDAHHKLIQPPRDQLEFWRTFDTSSSSSSEEYELPQDDMYRPPIARQASERVQIQEERHEFCVQCNAWPEVTDCTGKDDGRIISYVTRQRQILH